MKYHVGKFYLIHKKEDVSIIARCMSSCEYGYEESYLFMEFDSKNNNLIGKSFQLDELDVTSEIVNIPQHWYYAQEAWRRYEV